MDPISPVIRMLVRLLVVVLVVVIRWVLKYLWVRLVPYVRGFLAITGFYVAAVVVLALVLGVLLILAWRREGRNCLLYTSPSPRD